MSRKVNLEQAPAIDWTGRKFNRWTVLRFSHWRVISNKPRAYWYCRCICSTERAVKGLTLSNSTSISCGCYGNELSTKRARPKGEAFLTHLLAQYRSGAAKRDYVFELTKSQFKALIIQACVYCGSPPILKTQPRLNGGMYCNGLDRKDNRIGYTLSNVVPCCETCNRGKGKQSMDMWMSYLKRVMKHISGKGGSCGS